MENTEKSAAPVGGGGAKEKLEKQARQLAYDVRYKVRQGLKAQAGGKSDPATVKKAYMSQLGKSPANPAVKTRAKQMLVGEEYINVNNLVADSTASAMYKVFVDEHHQKDADGNTIPHEEINEDETKEKTYKVRVTDKDSGNSYVRNASRAKIAELRSNPNISSVEMTEYGEPTRSEKHKGSQTASVKAGKGVGDDKEVAKENYTWKDAFGQLIEKTKNDEGDKKITGKGVNNAKLIKVFPDEVKEGYGSKKKHDCASKVKHEEYGIGKCIPEQHTILEDGTVSHYDVEFEEYIVENCPVEELEILVTEMHSHSAKKKVSEALNPADQEEDERKDDKLFGSPNKKKGKKAKKDYDGDGKIESGTDEYLGSKDKAIKKAMSKEEVEKLEEKDSYKKVAAVIDYYRSKKGTGEAVKDTEKGDTKDAKKERDYAAFERGKMKKDDPDWKHKKGSTSESVEAEKYIETIQQIKKAELQADIKRWTPEPEEDQKKVAEGKVANKEVEDLQKASETGKGKYVAKADAVPQVGGPDKEGDEDPRSMKTKWNLVKNRLRALGLNMSQELEGDSIEESEKLAQKAYDRAQKLGAKRRSSSNPRGIGKSERAGYNLAQSQRSRNTDAATQGGNQTGGGSKSFGYAKNKSNPVKSKRTGDTGALGHYKKRDEKTSVGKKGGKLKTPKYKLSSGERLDHHSTQRDNLKDPKKNPKHTANESVQSALDALNTFDAKNAKLHGSVTNK